MSGHSKWATTKRAKAVTDAKRASQFTRLSRAITIAVRDKGSDTSSNFSLRLAIEHAREANMPKENIERAIQRGSGELSDSHIEEIFYEGYGPGGVALIIKVLTDNRNRSVSDIKHILGKYGGNLSGINSVSWMFEKKGIIGIKKEYGDEKHLLQFMEYGIDDIIHSNDGITLITSPEKLQYVKDFLERDGVPLEFIKFDYWPKTIIYPDEQARFLLQKSLDELDGLDDVADYYTNVS